MKISEALKALENSKNLSFKELLKICEAFFEGPRNDGSSHNIFKTPWKGKPWINIQKDGKMAKPYQVKQVQRALIKLKNFGDNDNG